MSQLLRSDWESQGKCKSARCGGGRRTALCGDYYPQNCRRADTRLREENASDRRMRVCSSTATWRIGIIATLCMFSAVMWCPINGSAWDKNGHEAIGMTAMSAINPAALVQLKRLLGGKDIFDVSGWAHKVNERHPETSPLHFQLQKELSRSDLDLSECPDGQCLLNAIKHFYGRLSGASDVPEMVYPGGLKFTDVDALKYLINLIGDLHQPLHVGLKRDNGGRDLMGVYFEGGEKKHTSLFDLWDNKIIQKMMTERAHFWNSGWTHVSLLRRGLMNTEKETWQNTPAANRSEIFDEWAKESANLAKLQCYKGGGIQTDFEMTQTEALISFEFIRNRLLLAGLRTSFVVNSILESREASKLRQGSAVVIPDESRSDSRQNVGNRHWIRNLLLNLSIVFIVVVVLLWMTRFFSSTSTSYGNITHGSRPAPKDKEMEKRS